MASIYDKVLQESTLFELFESNSYSDTVKALILAQQEITAKILSIPNDTWTKKRLQEIRKIIDEQISNAYVDTLPTLQQELPLIAEVVAINILGDQFTVVSNSVLDHITSNKLEIQGYQADELFKSISDNHARQLRTLVASGVAQGKTSQTIVNELIQKHSQLTKGQLRTAIFTTISEARAYTSYNSFNEFQKGGIIDGYEYVAVLDGRTTEYCRDHDGRRYYKPIGEIQNKINVHFNCLSGDSLVSSISAIKLMTKRMYKGKVYIITTAKGNKITCTPNHPILTDNGFLSADKINYAHKIGTNQRKITSVDNVNNNKGISTIENLFSSLSESSKMFTVKVPMTSENFHGDIGFDEYVDIVCTDRLLSNSIVSCFGDGIVNNNFKKRRFNAFGFFDRLASFFHSSLGPNHASNGIMGIFDLVKPSFIIHKPPFNSFLLRLGSNINTLSNKLRSKDSNTNIKPAGNTSNPNPVFVKSDSTLKSKNTIMPFMEVKGDSSTFGYNSSDDSMGEGELLSNILSGSLGDEVFFDDIVSIETRDDMLHVYNLENELHYYTANNIINHNCRSRFIPFTESTKKDTRASQFGQVPDEPYSKWFAKQDESFQRKVLGSKKFNAYKNGDYKIGGLPDIKGQKLDLDEISSLLKALRKKD